MFKRAVDLLSNLNPGKGLLLLIRNKRIRAAIPDCGSVADYETLDLINQGACAAVYRAQHNRTGEIVAMKAEFDGLSPSSLTEIDILRSLNRHPSVADFKQVVVDDKDGVYIVMEYVENDLKSYMGCRRDFLTMNEVKFFVKQLLEGVKFLHENKVMHRDLKPANVLINRKGELKICDFGSSCRFPSDSGSYSTRIGTLWYIAPEIIMGNESYTCAVDMWSIGCIMGELVLKEVLFRGRSDVNQLDTIFKIIGKPSERGFGSLPTSNNAKFVVESNNLLRSRFCVAGAPKLSSVGFDLLNRLLSYDPAKRITAESALKHAWFKEY